MKVRVYNRVQMPGKRNWSFSKLGFGTLSITSKMPFLFVCLNADIFLADISTPTHVKIIKTDEEQQSSGEDDDVYSHKFCGSALLLIVS